MRLFLRLRSQTLRRNAGILALLLGLATVAAAQTEIPGTVAPRSMIEGRVLAPGNQPLHGATVVLIDFSGTSRRTAFTDDSGTFVFTNLRPGQYQIQASLPGFATQTVRIDHDGERDNSLRIVLEPRPTGTEAPSAALTAVWALRIPPAALEEYNQGIEEMRKKHPDVACEHFTKAATLYPEYAAAHAALGTLALNGGKAEAAQAAFTRALEIDGNLLDAQLGLAAVALSGKHYETARTHLLKARALKPDDWRILHQLGETEWQLGLDGEAEANLTRAVELNPDSPRTHLLLVNVLAIQEKLPETLAAMDEFLRRFPEDPFAAQVRKKRDVVKKQLNSKHTAPPL